ncbi:hypothetical protein U8607_19505 [Methylobacterium durans]|nr:hypothetical protein [Methylobacterium durans]MEA1834284.1 hypothetical protein [Methylobacterium durans]
MGCDDAQGYLYAKPLAGSCVPRLLGTWDGSEIGGDSRIVRSA